MFWLVHPWEFLTPLSHIIVYCFLYDIICISCWRSNIFVSVVDNPIFVFVDFQQSFKAVFSLLERFCVLFIPILFSQIPDIFSDVPLEIVDVPVIFPTWPKAFDAKLFVSYLVSFRQKEHFIVHSSSKHLFILILLFLE